MAMAMAMGTAMGTAIASGLDVLDKYRVVEQLDAETLEELLSKLVIVIEIRVFVFVLQRHDIPHIHLQLESLRVFGLVALYEHQRRVVHQPVADRRQPTIVPSLLLRSAFCELKFSRGSCCCSGVGSRYRCSCHWHYVGRSEVIRWRLYRRRKVRLVEGTPVPEYRKFFLLKLLV